MKVLKFGGTSVGTVESISNVRDIVENLTEPAIVVVSALGGITDRLIATAHLAEEGFTENWRESFLSIKDRHMKVIDGIVRAECKDNVVHEVTLLLDELYKLYSGVAFLNDLSERVLDRIVSFGERMSTAIVGGAITGITRIYSPDFIRTERRYGRNRLDTAATSRLIADRVAPELRKHNLLLAAGFISSGTDNRITNLGRGGSDYTAAILAAEFNADILEIWTDVDGFLSADPRKIKDAHIIERMTFVEAMELCNFGAKVVYPPTIYPVFHKGIPIVIKNTFNPSAPGTLISERTTCDRSAGCITGISSLPACTLFTIRATDDVAPRAYNAMARKGIDVYLSGLQQPGSDMLQFVVRDTDADEALDELALEFSADTATKIEILPERRNLAIVAAVGDSMNNAAELCRRFSEALAADNIEVFATSGNTSHGSAALLVAMNNETASLTRLHSLVFNAS